jgi:tetratricopeptide (TPR) repeat protein
MRGPWARSRRGGGAIVLVVALALAGAARAQDVSPLAPMTGDEEGRPAPGIERPTDGQGVVIPLPQAGSRVEAADRARVHVAATLPASWTSVATRYQPYWAGVEPLGAFGAASWTPWFAGAGFVPVLSAHPFFSPWGLLSTDGWMYDRYRAIWGPNRAPGERSDAAIWLQRGDRAMLADRPRDAVQAYRRLTQIASDVPLGYFGLGLALAELGEDDAAAASLRQALDRYPGWISPSADWRAMVGDGPRLDRLLGETRQRAAGGGKASVFVAGVVHIYGGAPEEGRVLLASLLPDEHAQVLLTRAESRSR